MEVVREVGIVGDFDGRVVKRKDHEVDAGLQGLTE